MMRKRVMLTTDDSGEAWERTLALAQGLTDRGHRVLVAHQGSAPSRRQMLDLADTDLLMQYGGFSRPGEPVPLERLASFHGWLQEVAERLEADVIHCSLAAHVQEDAPAMQVFSCGARDHGDGWAEKRTEPAIDPDQDARLGWALQEADVTVTSSDAAAELLRARASDVASDVQVVPPGTPRMREARPESPLLLAGDRSPDASGFAVLDEALAGLPWRAEASDPSYEGGLRRLRAAGDLSRRQEDRLLEQTALFVAPSRLTSSGLAIARAAAHRCPLVLSDLPGHRETWKDAAMYVEAGNAQAWHDALRTMCDEPSLREDLAAQARKRAEALPLYRFLGGHEKLFAKSQAVFA